jgi:hypothetical protein
MNNTAKSGKPRNTGKVNSGCYNLAAYLARSLSRTGAVGMYLGYL